MGVADFDGDAQFGVGEKKDGTWMSDSMFLTRTDAFLQLPVRKISTFMSTLKHEALDVLKMDIEGAEYGVLRDLCKERLDVKQIVVEFHEGAMGCRKTFVKTLEALELLQRAGYRILWRHPNHQEMTIIHESLLAEERRQLAD
jgi:hypothetical protein